MNANGRGQYAGDLIGGNETIHVASVTCVCVDKVRMIVDRMFGKVKQVFGKVGKTYGIWVETNSFPESLLASEKVVSEIVCNQESTRV